MRFPYLITGGLSHCSFSRYRSLIPLYLVPQARPPRLRAFTPLSVQVLPCLCWPLSDHSGKLQRSACKRCPIRCLYLPPHAESASASALPLRRLPFCLVQSQPSALWQSRLPARVSRSEARARCLVSCFVWLVKRLVMPHLWTPLAFAANYHLCGKVHRSNAYCAQDSHCFSVWGSLVHRLYEPAY